MPDEPDFIYPLERLDGFWATHVKVYRTRHDFTLDFMRVDPADPSTAILVVRIALSPSATESLTLRLATEWKAYGRGMLSFDVLDDETQEED